MSPDLRVLENDVWQVGLLPETGMATAFGRVKRDGSFVDFMRPTPEASYGKRSDCASFPLVPWSNRVKDGRFVFRGKEHRARVNAADGSAIHGTARDFPWDVVHADGLSLVAELDSRRHDGAAVPFAYFARAEFRLDGPRFSMQLGVKNVGGEAIPAGFGHHPYFQRCLSGSDDAVSIEVPCDEYFPLEADIPIGSALPVDGRMDFRALRPLDPSTALDECLTGRRPGAPVRMAYPQSGLRIAFSFDPVFANVVVYAPLGRTFFAIEPVTNANDGFNLFARGVRGSGVIVLEPGEERAGSVTMTVEA